MFWFRVLGAELRHGIMRLPVAPGGNLKLCNFLRGARSRFASAIRINNRLLY